jgi:16S rRNA (guanine966-N2)-methyltransferase
MRIVGGRLRGRALAAPRSREVRPTSDRLRESLFNVLLHSYALPTPETRVLDLFAGTGALGLEAISRGAAHAVFVETGLEGRGLIRTNVESLSLTGVSRILRRDATDLGRAGTIAPFDLVFCDPPYGHDLVNGRSPARRPAAGLRRMRSASWKSRPMWDLRSLPALKSWNGAKSAQVSFSCLDSTARLVLISRTSVFGLKRYRFTPAIFWKQPPNHRNILRPIRINVR